jgi:hypothetical protein
MIQVFYSIGVRALIQRWSQLISWPNGASRTHRTTEEKIISFVGVTTPGNFVPDATGEGSSIGDFEQSLKLHVRCLRLDFTLKYPAYTLHIFRGNSNHIIYFIPFPSDIRKGLVIAHQRLCAPPLRLVPPTLVEIETSCPGVFCLWIFSRTIELGKWATR